MTHLLTNEYLKNDLGSKLWKRLSQALGKKITKNNVQAIVEEQVYQAKQGKIIAKELIEKEAFINNLSFPEIP